MLRQCDDGRVIAHGRVGSWEPAEGQLTLSSTDTPSVNSTRTIIYYMDSFWK